jgi:hypothetical protein
MCFHLHRCTSLVYAKKIIANQLLSSGQHLGFRSQPRGKEGLAFEIVSTCVHIAQNIAPAFVQLH